VKKHPPDQGCQIFLGEYYPNRKNVPNEHKMYQMVIKYPKCLLNIPNGHKIYQHFPIYGPPKFTQIRIFGLKRNHLATLHRMPERSKTRILLSATEETKKKQS
jgi:hypothetical protein